MPFVEHQGRRWFRRDHLELVKHADLVKRPPDKVAGFDRLRGRTLAPTSQTATGEGPLHKLRLAAQLPWSLSLPSAGPSGSQTVERGTLMRTRMLLGPVLLACVALSGCGAVETPSPSADTTKATKKATLAAGPPGTWAFRYHGATGYVLIPVPRTDPRLAEIEGYRKRAKATPVCYAMVKVDNTRGTDELFVGGLLTSASDFTAEYDSANYWVPLWEKNRGGGNKQLDGNDPVVNLRHPYDNIQLAPGMPRPGYKDYGFPEKATIVFAVGDVSTSAGPGRCDKQREPSDVTVSVDVDDIATAHATKVPTSATP